MNVRILDVLDNGTAMVADPTKPIDAVRKLDASTITWASQMETALAAASYRQPIDHSSARRRDDVCP